jgi:23S rRNA (pseudouridine1915-N3)-methyltransferase
MLQVRILAVGENKEKWLTTFLEVYSKKLKHFCDFEFVAIKPYKEARNQVEDKLKKESESILKHIADSDYLILCDLRGQALTSIQLSEKLEKIFAHSGKKRYSFLIGGAFGVSDEIYQRADLKLKLSEMTMNHHLALAMLQEQIYRSFAIQKNLPYHNE